jgi:hypothetical protein
MRRVLIATLAAALAGCSSTDFSTDLSYVRASGLGYRNAALYSAGYLFLWNMEANSLTVLENGIPLEKLDAFAAGPQRVAAEAALSRKIAFTAESAVREKYRSIYTGLSAAYVRGLAAGEDMRSRWYVDEATAPNSPYRYVLITGLVRADRATATVGGKSGSEIGSIGVEVPGLGSIYVGIDSGAAAECSGNKAPCFFDATVLQPYIASDGNLNFRPAMGTDADALSEALRKL